MTEKRKNTFGVIKSFNDQISSLRIEGERCYRGMRFRFSGIIGVKEFSDESIEIMNHGGRILLTGKRLAITILENSQVEISGRVEEIGFVYGKNQ